MKIQSYRCDNCGYEVFYEDNHGKKIDFPSYIEITHAIGKKETLQNKIVCSPICLELLVWNTCVFGKPIIKDVIERLEKKINELKNSTKNEIPNS